MSTAIVKRSRRRHHRIARRNPTRQGIALGSMAMGAAVGAGTAAAALWAYDKKKGVVPPSSDYGIIAGAGAGVGIALTGLTGAFMGGGMLPALVGLGAGGAILWAVALAGAPASPPAPTAAA